MTLDPPPASQVHVVPLRPSITSAGSVVIGIWGLGMITAMSVSFLEGTLPDAALGVIAFGVIVSAVIATIVMQRRTLAKATRWIVHFDGATTLLEDQIAGTKTPLTSENVTLGLFAFTPARGPRREVPTVVLALRRRLVVGGPPELVDVTDHVEQTGLPQLTADHATWEALRLAAARSPSPR